MLFSYSKIFLLFLLSIALLGIGWQFTNQFSFRDSAIILTKGDPIKILPGQTLTQTFIPKQGALKRIEFLVRNPEPKKGDLITVTLADSHCQMPLRETTLKKGYLQSDNLFIATFNPPLSVSADDVLCVMLHFNGQKHRSEFLRFFTQESRSETFRELKINSEVQADQVLSIRPAYTYPTLFQNLETLNNRISQYKPWFLKDVFLTGIVFTFLSSTLIVLIGLILVRNTNED